jgi:hypothetical protein
MKLAIQGTCLCQAVQLGVTRRPRQVTQCNCSVCRRYGTLWAYFRRSAVSITAPRGGLQKYVIRRGGLAFVRCASCGCVIYWDGPSRSPDRRMGINTRLLDPTLMADVPVKLLDGAGKWRTLGTYVRPAMWISLPSRTVAVPRVTRRGGSRRS